MFEVNMSFKVVDSKTGDEVIAQAEMVRASEAYVSRLRENEERVDRFEMMATAVVVSCNDEGSVYKVEMCFEKRQRR